MADRQAEVLRFNSSCQAACRTCMSTRLLAANDKSHPFSSAAMQVFDPVLRWAEGELGARLSADDSLTGMDQSEELINNARSYLHGQLTHVRVGAGCWPSDHAAECLEKGSGSTHARWKLLWLFVGAQGWTSGSSQLWTQRHRRVDL